MATTETRQMFEQLLKKAERKKGKDKKPVVTDRESEIVGNLERSLQKDDPLLESNTYDGEAEKNLKNLRNSGGVKGKENKDGAEQTATQQGSYSSRRRRREVRKNLMFETDKTMFPRSGNVVRKSDQKETGSVSRQAVSKQDSRRRRRDVRKNLTFETDKVMFPRSGNVVTKSKSDRRETVRKQGTVRKEVPGKIFQDLAKTDHDENRAKRKNDQNWKTLYQASEMNLDSNNSKRSMAIDSDHPSHSTHHSLRDRRSRQKLQKSSDGKIPIKSSDISKSAVSKTVPNCITVENVDSVLHVLDTVWESHSDASASQSTKPTLNNGKSLDLKSAPNQNTVMPDVSDTIWQNHSNTEADQSTRRSDIGESSAVTTAPNQITVENVDSTSGELKTIWENCSNTEADHTTKKSGMVKAPVLVDAPNQITVENVDCESDELETIWESQKKSSNRSVTGWVGGSIDDTAQSGLTTYGNHPVEKISIINHNNSNERVNVGASQADMKNKQTQPAKLIVDCSASEPNLCDSAQESHSQQTLDIKKCRDSVSGPELPREMLLQTFGEMHPGVTLVESYGELQKVLMDEYFTSSESSEEEVMVLNSDDTRKKFWEEFWRQYGVEINIPSDSKVSLIEDANDDSKKVPKGKRKKTKKKEADEKLNEEAVYAVVQKLSGTKKKDPNILAEDDTGEGAQDENIPKPKPAPRKVVSQEEKVDEPETVPKAIGDEGEEAETIPKVVTKRRKKVKKQGAQRALPRSSESGEAVNQEESGDTQDPPVVDATTADAPAETPADPQIEDDGTILGVTIHYCDHIRIDPKYVVHPVVKVSVVNGVTGRDISKFDSSRHVSSYYESDAVSSIVPLMTQPYDFKANRSLLPRWEEMLIFNESFTRLTQHATTPEIRDFIKMENASSRRSSDERGWHNIAWAFLKLVSNNGKPNAGKRMRLQLFYPPRTRGGPSDPNVDMAYDWWLNYARQRYPGTLFVTVKAVLPQLDLESSLRSHSALQREESSLTFNQLNESLERAESESQLQNNLDDLAEIQQWTRLPGQTCKIPNSPFLRLWAGSEGAFMIQFSHRGTRLAVACRHGTTFPILLYRIPSGDELGAISGHQQLVYDLRWSKNDRFLLSASADGTAQIWDVENRAKPVHTLPHPCYVYSACFHPTASHLIATGGYDTILRVWNIASITSQLTQEMEGHKAIINSIIVDSTGLNMFSGDGAGVILCWDCHSFGRAKKNIKTNWSLKYRIEDRDLAGICINNLQLHPHNNKILIHCRDSSVRLLDSRIHSIKKFSGLLNYRQLLRSSVTPCGSLIFSGSEDGYVYVWNVETGDQVAIYNELGYLNAVHTVVYHPHEHLVAFCSYAPSQSVLLYKFNSAVATMEAGFKSSEEDDKIDETVPNINANIEAAKTAMNLERIKHKLDSVLMTADDDDQGPFLIRRKFNHSMVDTMDNSTGSFLPPIPQGQLVAPARSASPFGRTDPSSLGSTFDANAQYGGALAPSFLSPHASPEARAVAQQFIRTGRQDQAGPWRPGVAAVGGSPYKSGLAPDVSFSTDKDGQQKLSISSAPGSQQQSVVVVLFEYQANRSDELTVVRGDMIKVLYKDSANWWFGEKVSDGRQGYFPSNYVEEQVPTGNMTQSEAKAPVFGVPESTPEKKVYALKMPGGRLNFYSQSESEGDDERLSNASTSSRQRRHEAKLKDTLERARQVTSPLSLKNTPSKSSSSTYPKSILHKESPRPKLTVQGPSSEGLNVKEVSFADEKNEKNPKARQNLLNSIQAALEKAEQNDEEVKKPSPSASPRQNKPQKKKPTRKPSQRKSSPVMQETTFAGDEKKVAKSTTASTTPKLAPTFSILKSVQAMMNENDETPFSQSVVGGHGVSTPARSKSKSDFRPTVHSTAVKKARTPVENEEDPLPAGSTVRKARALPKFGAKQIDEETIPMVEISRSKTGRSSPAGQSNPAFDSSP